MTFKPKENLNFKFSQTSYKWIDINKKNQAISQFP